MNPELERLLAALAARDSASPEQFIEAEAEVDFLTGRLHIRSAKGGRPRPHSDQSVASVVVVLSGQRPRRFGFPRDQEGIEHEVARRREV